MNTTTTAESISANFHKLVSTDAMIHNAHLLVHSNASGLHLNLAEGDARVGKDNMVQTGQPVYMASVGKIFTAVLVAILCEQGKLSFEDRIADFLDPNLLKGLHVFRGTEYTQQIQLKHLLNHTSGLPDYFEEKPAKGPGMIEQLFLEPDRSYLPQEIVMWSKINLKSHFPPGKGFYYSDTGYHILGLVVEAVTGLPFPRVLSRLIFEPLDMNQAFLLGHSLPLNISPYPTAGVYFGHTNIVNYRALSTDYAGGGITAPLEDLLKFMQALTQGRLLSLAMLRKMDNSARFAIGVNYAYGFMKLHAVPFLMPARYASWGNAGSTGAFMFYHPGLAACLIGSLNQFRYHEKGIRLMLRVMDMLMD